MAEATQEERWLPIPGHDGYEVSDLGRVRSVDRLVRGKGASWQRKHGRLLKPRVDKDGYLRAQLANQRVYPVHHLVLITFVASRPPGAMGLHGNGDQRDNRPQNLRWGTAVDNMADRIIHGTNPELNKSRCPRGHPLDGDNLVASQQRIGKRTCLACVKGRRHIDWCRRAGVEPPTLQEASDRFYRQICAGIVDGRANQTAYPNRLPPHLYRPART